MAIEDQRFYKDDGIDVTGIFRAAIKDVVHGQALQGASTITMQLVRNLYLGGDERTLKQKITEAKLAIEDNKAHSKRSILTELPQRRRLRNGRRPDAIGVQAAFAHFFDKPVSQLDSSRPRCSPGLPQARRSTTRSSIPPPPASGATRCCGKMAELHDISPQQA